MIVNGKSFRGGRTFARTNAPFLRQVKAQTDGVSIPRLVRHNLNVLSQPRLVPSQCDVAEDAEYAPRRLDRVFHAVHPRLGSFEA